MRSYEEPRVNVRTMDEWEFPRVCREVFAVGGRLPLRVTGASMRPFLQEGRDTVVLCAPPEKLRRGDVVLFARPGGKLVLHRIIHRKKAGLYITGDYQTALEGPVPATAVLGLVCQVQRGSRVLGPHSLEWQFYEKVWRWLRPVRPWVRGVLRRLKGNSR